MSMVFDFKEAARFRPGFDRKAGAERIQALREKYGSVTVERIIKDARRVSSPLHKAFIWDAEEALAHSHLVTAQYLLSNFVKVTIEDDGSRTAEKACVPVYLTEEDDDRAYVDVDTAMSRLDYRKQVLEQARRELFAFRRKYAYLNELAGVFVAIEALEKWNDAAA